MPTESTATHHPSRSTEQQDAEKIILEKIKEQHGFSFKKNPKGTPLSKDTHVKLDGIDEGKQAICEIYAHIGPLKGGQIGKVAKDILKLHIIGKSLEEQEGKGPWAKYLFFADKDAKKILDEDCSSWLAWAAKSLKINAKVVDLPTDIRDSLLAAQKRQKR